MIFFHFTGIGLVCPVRFVTRLKCPGCGITHMCLALLHLDFAAACMANPALFLLNPILVVILVQHSITYIRTGCRQLRPVQNILLWICIIILLIYGVMRNIFSLP
ncbi:MAG: DUF2752 domain-containing protein [Lachnospiraceae bacterium]|nr:DUF2752 domain-containing protein [Lachnospiraceae bacterium]